MKYSDQTCKILIFACLVASFTVNIVDAGTITMTSVDSQPFGAASNNIIILPDKKVTLTTTADNGTVQVKYTPSAGVKMDSDTGTGTATETGMFSFGTNCIGQSNSIAVQITHNSTNNSGKPITCVGGADNVTFSIFIPKIEIKDADDKVIGTSPTPTVIVGQEVHVGLKPTDGLGITVSKWTVPGTTFKSFDADDQTGTVTYLSSDDLSHTNATVYWSDALASGQVQCAVTAQGQQYNLTAPITVVRPTANVTSKTGNIGFVQYGSYLYLSYGDASSPTSVSGIRYFETMSIPAGFEGITEWVQIFYSQEQHNKYITNSNGTNIIYSQKLTGANVVDTTYPYTIFNNDPITDVDSPAAGLSINGIYVSRSDSIGLWFMFKPLAPGASQYVPLSIIDWSWSATASRTNTNANWNIDTSTHNVNPPGINTTNFPIWNGNVNELRWVPE